MTPRERLLTVLRGGAADRVPVTAYEFSRFDERRPLSDPGNFSVLPFRLVVSLSILATRAPGNSPRNRISSCSVPTPQPCRAGSPHPGHTCGDEIAWSQ